MVNEQYLIYDAIGMIGAVGGTMGMCIGFSFDSIIHYLINLLPNILSIIQIKLIGNMKELEIPPSTGIGEKTEDRIDKLFKELEIPLSTCIDEKIEDRINKLFKEKEQLKSRIQNIEKSIQSLMDDKI